MVNLKKVAQSAVVLSELMEGREKMTTEEACEMTTFTIIEIDYVETKEGKYVVTVPKEKDNKYYCGGTVLTKICDALVAECGSLGKVNSELSNQGGLAVRFSTSKTKDKNNITLVEVL